MKDLLFSFLILVGQPATGQPLDVHAMARGLTLEECNAVLAGVETSPGIARDRAILAKAGKVSLFVCDPDKPLPSFADISRALD